MAIRKWVVLDTANDVYVDSLCIREGDVAIIKRRLKGGLRDGIDIIEVDNGVLSFTVLLTRGMNIWRGNCGGIPLKWDSPVRGPVHPKYVPCREPSGLGWLYGFDEWFVRCGLQSNGSPDFDAQGRLIYSLHGGISNTPASYAEIVLDTETQEITVTGTVHEARIFSRNLQLQVTYRTKAGEPSFTSRDVVTNLSAEPGSMQLLYHINTGQPFVVPGSRAAVPYETMAPRTPAAKADLPAWNLCGPETSGSEEVVFFFDPAADEQQNTEVMLMNPQQDHAILLKFNKRQLPYFSLWKSRLANADGYVAGMEPSVNFPNERSFEESKGRVVPLAPGESREFDLTLEFLQEAAEVARAEEKIRRLQSHAEGKTVHPADAGWGP
ncbi:MAG: aldose 1-epimerase family protein [Planctomycetaceae bacterium]|nr:aldose 1-epimerase family protein [Planctomycetaceae bacterium]